MARRRAAGLEVFTLLAPAATRRETENSYRVAAPLQAPHPFGWKLSDPQPNEGDHAQVAQAVLFRILCAVDLARVGTCS
jgi:hypothetical protein